MNNFYNLPEDLKRTGYFCLWKYEMVKGRKTKVPYNPNNPQFKGNSTDKSKFARFNDTLDVYMNISGFSGMGIGAFDDVSAIDIDHCVDESGELSEMAADIIATMDSYTEISPSGTGIRILFKTPGLKYDREKFYIKHPHIPVEVYVAGSTNRFLTVTGNKISGDSLSSRVEQLQIICDKYMRRSERKAPAKTVSTPELSLSDSELLEKARNAKNGSKFSALYDEGDISGYNSHSEADAALCQMLAFWTGNNDEERIKDLFKRSGLMRDKAKRDKYLTQTVQAAMTNCTEVYNPQKVYDWDTEISDDWVPDNWKSEESEDTPPEKKAGAEESPEESSEESPEESSEESPEESSEEKPPKPDNVSLYIDTLMSKDLERFKKKILTGYDNLDKQTGGLYAGLYVIAAISSLGKTTFIHQMADQIAAGGTDVIFFSLEQSKLELITKSIARITAQNDKAGAVTSLSIRQGYLPPQVIAASDQYKATVGDRVSIVEGNFDCTVSWIKEYVKEYMKTNKTAPVVIIDYLQIIKPEQTKGTTKEAVDFTVTELRRMSRDLALTVIAISSLNRSNYQTPVEFESLKESGGIEYTADAVYGLQLHCLKADPLFEKDGDAVKKRETVKRAKEANPREIDLTCLKTRYGSIDVECCYKYYPANDLFIPVDSFPESERDKEKKNAKRV